MFKAGKQTASTANWLDGLRLKLDQLGSGGCGLPNVCKGERDASPVGETDQPGDAAGESAKLCHLAINQHANGDEGLEGTLAELARRSYYCYLGRFLTLRQLGLETPEHSVAMRDLAIDGERGCDRDRPIRPYVDRLDVSEGALLYFQQVESQAAARGFTWWYASLFVSPDGRWWNRDRCREKGMALARQRLHRRMKQTRAADSAVPLLPEFSSDLYGAAIPFDVVAKDAAERTVTARPISQLTQYQARHLTSEGRHKDEAPMPAAIHTGHRIWLPGRSLSQPEREASLHLALERTEALLTKSFTEPRLSQAKSLVLMRYQGYGFDEIWQRLKVSPSGGYFLWKQVWTLLRQDPALAEFAESLTERRTGGRGVRQVEEPLKEFRLSGVQIDEKRSEELMARLRSEVSKLATSAGGEALPQMDGRASTATNITHQA